MIRPNVVCEYRTLSCEKVSARARKSVRYHAMQPHAKRSARAGAHATFAGWKARQEFLLLARNQLSN